MNLNWTEKQKTLALAGAAVFLALVAFVTAPKTSTPDAFFDQGEPFFPDFTDPNSAVTLEVIRFDEETGSTMPFKVTFKEGQWTIPSHYDYPADQKDRLAKTAAAIIELRKDDFRTDNVADHEACGVLDPLDESVTSLQGRGERVIIRGENDQVLADIIFGKKVEGREGFRFVRLPGQKRVYAAKTDIEITTNFADWIDTDLLKVNRNEIEKVVLKDYSVDERTGIVRMRDVVTLTKNNNTWTADKLAADQEVDSGKMTNLLTALDQLSIVGVRPKPAGLSASLTRISDGVRLTQEDLLSLQSKGYFFSRSGQLLSNEGELQAETSDGVIYTLRFGEVVYGRGLAVTAGVDTIETEQKGPAENRYLFITASFDAQKFPEPKKPANTDFLNKADSLWTDADRKNKELYDAHKDWEEKVERAKKRVDELNARFARWYYVISQSSFEKLHLKRADLIREKKK